MPRFAAALLLDRGEGIPEDQLDAYLAKLKAQPE
jgi:hypothetical protein